MKNTSSKKPLILIAILSTLVAIGAHLYLNAHHVDLKMGTGESSICNVSATLNCDVVATSSYAELFGVPIALLGAFTNGLLLIFLLLGRLNWTENSDRTERYAFWLSSFILLVSLIMGSISFFVLKTGCPFCMTTYATSLITWLCLFFALRPGMAQLSNDVRDAFTTEKWVLGMLVAVPVLAFIINGMILDGAGYKEVKRITDSSLANWKNSPAQNFDLQNGLIFQKGSEEAKVTIVEFADFLCSHCKVAAPVLHKFAESHPDVKIIFKNFPLDGVCNTAVNHKGDGKRCELSYATFCAEKIAQKGWATHNLIFDNQETYFSRPMNQITEEICQATGVDCAQLKTCMNSEEIHESVRKMASEGEKAQISGTPSVFFNGKLLQGGNLLPVLESTYRNYNK